MQPSSISVRRVVRHPLFKAISVCAGMLAACLGCAATPMAGLPEPVPDAAPAALERWRGLKFGMFIHWGPVSLTGLEIGWSRGGERRGHGGTGTTPVEVYDNLYKQFNPVGFDADEWVRIAKDAGMRYMVFTTKHHDGFCMFDTHLSDYRITSPQSPYGRDIVRQLADACHKGGLPWGIYYSQPDWHHPDYRNGDRHAEYIKYLHGQLRELLSNYGRVDVVFFDGLAPRGEASQNGRYAGDELWDAPNLIRMCRRLQPGVIINNRCGVPADYDTPENTVGFFQQDRAWETCATITTQWAWKPNDRMRSLEQCIHMLVTVVTGDGNLLLNVGPTPEGHIEDRQVGRLKEIGRWLDTYGESIYETRGGPLLAPDEEQRPHESYSTDFTLAGGRWWGGSTCKGNLIYLHILRWPQDTLVLPAIDRRIVRHTVLTGGSATVTQTPDAIRVHVPAEQRDPLDTIIRLELDEPVHGLLPRKIAA